MPLLIDTDGPGLEVKNSLDLFPHGDCANTSPIGIRGISIFSWPLRPPQPDVLEWGVESCTIVRRNTPRLELEIFSDAWVFDREHSGPGAAVVRPDDFEFSRTIRKWCANLGEAIGLLQFAINHCWKLAASAAPKFSVSRKRLFRTVIGAVIGGWSRSSLIWDPP